MCRDEDRKAKGQMDLNFGRDAERAKSFYRCVSQKSKAQERLPSMINKAGKLHEKAEVLNKCFALVFTGNCEDFTVFPHLSSGRTTRLRVEEQIPSWCERRSGL